MGKNKILQYCGMCNLRIMKSKVLLDLMHFLSGCNSSIITFAVDLKIFEYMTINNCKHALHAYHKILMN
jgi:hypothetical protein